MSRARALADLHRHLDGSLRAQTLRDLADDCGVSLPPEGVRFHPNMGLQQALACFAVTLSVLQRPAAVRRVASEICEDAQREGVTTLEIRFAPQLHRAAAPEEIVDAALDGVAGRAGLLLCGLYGESPAVLESLVDIAADRPGVVGIDLAGGPTSDHRYRLEDYAGPFGRARGVGLGRTVHAAEGRPAREIRVAIQQLHAQRIGHATTLLDSEEALSLVLERRITIEACPSSNVHTGVIAELSEHPLGRWLKRGVRVCLCTDNTLLSAIDAPTEHDNALTAEGMDRAALARAVECGHAAAFSRV